MLDLQKTIILNDLKDQLFYNDFKIQNFVSKLTCLSCMKNSLFQFSTISILWNMTQIVIIS